MREHAVLREMGNPHAYAWRLGWFAPVLLAAASAQQLQTGPLHDSGQSVTGAFEGWFQNQDGSFNLLFGYFNRNLKQQLDIPIGANNRMEPGGPDRGQPTHFLPRRQWGVFTITVPKDFGSNQITWTLTANGVTTAIPGSLNPLWELSPLRDVNGNTPPFLGFAPAGPFVQGPRGQRTSLTTVLPNPVSLALWTADDASVIPGDTQPKTAAVTITWSKFRGPGSVTFTNDKPAVEAEDFAAPPSATFRGRAVTTATFSEPGDYVLRAVANDWSGDGGRFQCCWSNAQVKVTVQPGR
jgi:hypothetical protein